MMNLPRCAVVCASTARGTRNNSNPRHAAFHAFMSSLPKLPGRFELLWVDLWIDAKPIERRLFGRVGADRAPDPEGQLESVALAIVRVIETVFDRRGRGGGRRRRPAAIAARLSRGARRAAAVRASSPRRRGRRGPA